MTLIMIMVDCAPQQGPDKEACKLRDTYKMAAEVYLTDERQQGKSTKLYAFTELAYEPLGFLGDYYYPDDPKETNDLYQLFVLNKFADPTSSTHDPMLAYKVLIKDGETTMTVPVDDKTNADLMAKSMYSLLAPLRDLSHWTSGRVGNCLISPDQQMTACFSTNEQHECVIERVMIPQGDDKTKSILVSDMGYQFAFEDFVEEMLTPSLYVRSYGPEPEPSIFSPVFEPDVSVLVKRLGDKTKSSYEFFGSDYPNKSATIGTDLFIVRDYEAGIAYQFVPDGASLKCTKTQLQTIFSDNELAENLRSFILKNQQKRLFYDFPPTYYDFGPFLFRDDENSDWVLYRRLTFTGYPAMVVDETPVKPLVVNLMVDNNMFKRNGFIVPKRLVFGNEYDKINYGIFAYEQVESSEPGPEAAISMIQHLDPSKCEAEPDSDSIFAFSVPIQGYGFSSGEHATSDTYNDCAKLCLDKTATGCKAFTYLPDSQDCYTLDTIPQLRDLKNDKPSSLFSRLLYKGIVV